MTVYRYIRVRDKTYDVWWDMDGPYLGRVHGRDDGTWTNSDAPTGDPEYDPAQFTHETREAAAADLQSAVWKRLEPLVRGMLEERRGNEDQTDPQAT